MADEPASPDLAERAHAAFEAFGRGDFDGTMRFIAPDAAWAMMGGEIFEGTAAIRAFMEEFYRQFEGLELEAEETRDLGREVVLVVNTMRGRPIGSSAEVRQRGAFVCEARAGIAVRVTAYSDVDEGRAVAERLAGSRSGRGTVR
jgi:ketosteroid isomerase-like protein